MRGERSPERLHLGTVRGRLLGDAPAFVLGVVQLAGPKGTLPHRTLGYIWVGLMLVVAASSFAIQGMRQLGPFSAIHLLSVMVVVLVPPEPPKHCWDSRLWPRAWRMS